MAGKDCDELASLGQVRAIRLLAASRVTKIYERHVKPLSPGERLLLLEMVARDLAAQPGVETPGLTRNIMELHGLGKEIWVGVDAQEYVNRLRDEWDRQAE